MLAKTGLVAALVFGLVGAGVFGALPAGAAEMNNEEQVVNQPGGGSGTGVLINEVEMNPPGRDTNREWVELYNPTQSDVDIGNFAIKTKIRQFTITVPAGTVIGAGEFYVVKVTGERLLNVEALTLLDASGRVVDTTPSLLDSDDDARTWQRMPDGASTWRFKNATQGEPNDPATYQKAERSASVSSTPSTASTSSAPQCLGSALCLEGTVFRMVDTDTLYVRTSSGDYRVDLSLTKVSRSDRTYENGSAITKRLCLGSDVLVDQDDGQAKTERVGRALAIKGMVYCGSSSLNQELLDSGFVGLDYWQCFKSEFASQPWAVRNGCK
jgi:hypothetical protein